MRPRPIPQLLVLTLLFALAACVPGLDSASGFGLPFFRFTSPDPGSLELEPSVDFRLLLPTTNGSLKLRVTLDGQPVDPATFRVGARDVRGTLEALAPGPHRLEASLRVAVLSFSLPLHAWIAFGVAAPASFAVRESVEQLHITHAQPDAVLELWDADGDALASARTDEQGSLIFRELAPGDGYRVVADGAPPEASRALRVLPVEGSTPPQSFYDGQVLSPGYGYLTTRDGTQLSVFVSLPGPVENGPYPVLVNYSGYDPSEPVGALKLGGFDLSFLCGEFPVLCDAPNAPEALIAGTLGFATVGVNMRGTGCSGGAYDFFEPLQLLDGYDIIEIVAAQPWAYKVGMVGISFPGISQLFVASTQPPHLAAITPLAVISGVDTTMSPGGILNNGFAIEWGREVLDRADPYGHGWEQKRVDAGDTICEENQLLHSQKVDIIAKAIAHPYYEADVYDPLNPRTFVDRIQVPVFTSGAWQDEQTGNHFPDLWTRFTGSPLVRYTGYNGAHADGFTPQVLAEWKNFLDFYLADWVSPVPNTLRIFGPLLFEEIFGARVGLPDERFLDFDSFEEAKAAYEAEQPVRILMENGGAPGVQPGAPVAGFELFFDSWPPPSTEPLRLYLHADGSLREFPPSEAVAASSFQHDDAKGQETYDVHDAFEKALPNITWLPEQPGRQVVFATEPLADDLVLIGHASADLWIQSTADDADLEVTLSEIRPDGKETYVASGWLRASRRALSPESTPLKPVQTHLEADAAPLPHGIWTPVRIEIYPFAHAFRAGSRLRMSVATPGGNKGRWKFDVLQLGPGVTHGVAHSSAYPSSLLLPVIPDVEVPTPLPPCPSLRSQPCRTHLPQLNASWE